MQKLKEIFKKTFYKRLISSFSGIYLILLKHFKETLQEVVSSVGQQIFNFSEHHTLKYWKVILNVTDFRFLSLPLVICIKLIFSVDHEI